MPPLTGTFRKIALGKEFNLAKAAYRPVKKWNPRSKSGLNRGWILYWFFKFLPYSDWMVETRIAVRHRVLKAATIEFGGVAIDCTIRNLSTTGALLELSSRARVPAEFTLAVPGDALRLPCTAVWRTEYRMGIRFD